MLVVRCLFSGSAKGFLRRYKVLNDCVLHSNNRNMKLLTHNLLTSRCMKGVSVGYPLAIVAKDIKVLESEFNSEFLTRLLPKIDWNTFWHAADSIGYAGDLPQTLNDDFDTNEELLRKVHHVLLEVEIINGELICPESGRSFPINQGIPNMLLNEDEL